MPGAYVWIWSADAGKYVKAQADAQGRLKAVIEFGNLEDIGDVLLTALANNDILYWDAAASKWKNIAHSRYTDYEAVLAIQADGFLLDSGENMGIRQALVDNETCSGLQGYMQAGTPLAIPQAVYVGADGKMELALATGAATMPAIALARKTVYEDAFDLFVLQGFFRHDAWDWTPGGLLYVSKDTAGALTQTLPAASGEQVQVVGVAITADIIYFNPSFELVEIS